MRRTIYYCALCEARNCATRPYYTLAAVMRHSYRLHPAKKNETDGGEIP